MALSRRAHDGRVRADALAREIEQALPARLQEIGPSLEAEARVRRGPQERTDAVLRRQFA